MQERGNATAEDRGDADLGSAGGTPWRARPRQAGHDSDHHQERDGKAADGRCPRPPIEPPPDVHAYRGTGAGGRRFDGIVDRGRALAPEVIRARWRLYGVLGRGSGAEGDEVLARAKPVAGDAAGRLDGAGR